PSFPTRRSSDLTFTVTIVWPKVISISSPGSTLTDGFATIPFTLMRSCSAICFASGRLLIRRDTFKYLSKRILLFLSFCFIPKSIQLLKRHLSERVPGHTHLSFHFIESEDEFFIRSA